MSPGTTGGPRLLDLSVLSVGIRPRRESVEGTYFTYLLFG